MDNLCYTALSSNWLVDTTLSRWRSQFESGWGYNDLFIGIYGVSGVSVAFLTVTEQGLVRPQGDTQSNH